MVAWYIYLHENHKNQLNVGEYTIHGSLDPMGTYIYQDMWREEHRRDIYLHEHYKNQPFM